MRDRKIILFFVVAILFAIGVMVWYFFKSSPTTNPSIATPSNPFNEGVRKPGREFINTSNASSTEGDTEYTSIDDRSLFHIWDKPTAGYTFVTRDVFIDSTATSTKKTPKQTKKTISYIVFVDRTTGHIYGHDIERHTTFQITNTTVPGVYDAYLVGNGTKVFMRFLEKDGTTVRTMQANIPTFVAGLDPKPLLNITYLQDTITSFAVSASSSLYSYLVPGPLGSTIYTSTSQGKLTFTTSPLREWTLSYGGETGYITTKPTAYVEGGTFVLPSKEYRLGNKTGLMSNPGIYGDILASMWTSRGLATFVYTPKGVQTSVLTIKTLASKCSWVTDTRAVCGVPTTLPQETSQGLPDEWFQGNVSFSDNLYTVYVDHTREILSASASILFYLTDEPGAPFDVIRPQSNLAGGLLFLNKRDGTLWFADLTKMFLD